MTGISAILADWGTTNRRAWAVDRDGQVLDRRRDDQGLLGVKDRAFEASFRGFIGDWLKRAEPGAPIVMAGMVGSKLGWREAPYLETPCRFTDLAGALTALPDLDGHAVRIVPGLVCRASGHPDVMRGEETQLYGYWLMSKRDRLCTLPGTHSKWAEIKDGGVASFRTYMTGEIFAQLSGSGTLAQLMQKDAPHDPAAFKQGLDRIIDANAGGLLSWLFSVRTLGLFGELPPAALASYLSGLLIGAELQDVFDMPPHYHGGPVAVIGSSKMVELYSEAIRLDGRQVEPLDGDPLLRSALIAIARDASLIR